MKAADIEKIVSICKEIVAEDRNGGVTMGRLFALEDSMKGGRMPKKKTHPKPKHPKKK